MPLETNRKFLQRKKTVAASTPLHISHGFNLSILVEVPPILLTYCKSIDWVLILLEEFNRFISKAKRSNKFMIQLVITIIESI